MSFSYQVDATVDEIAAGALDDSSTSYADQYAADKTPANAATRESLAKANRAIGEFCSQMPPGTRVIIELQGHAVPKHGPGETLVVKISAYENLVPSKVPATVKGKPEPEMGEDPGEHDTADDVDAILAGDKRAT